MVKKIAITFFLYIMFLNSGNAQLLYRIGFGLGTSPYFDYNIVKTANVDIGYSILNNLYIYGGINMFSQSSYVFNFEKEDEWEENKTESFTSVLIHSALNYSVTIKTLNPNDSFRSEKRICIFPEINAYFNPYLNRKYKPSSGKKYTAPYATQWSFGCGGGISYGTSNKYLALKYELNTIDNLESIRQMVSIDKNHKYNHVISLVFAFD